MSPGIPSLPQAGPAGAPRLGVEGVSRPTLSTGYAPVFSLVMSSVTWS